jgi:hypothetical protein
MLQLLEYLDHVLRPRPHLRLEGASAVAIGRLRQDVAHRVPNRSGGPVVAPTVLPRPRAAPRSALSGWSALYSIPSLTIRSGFHSWPMASRSGGR